MATATELPEWLDGPKFAAWLEDKGIAANDIDPGHGSAPGKWRRGAGVSIYKADEILTRFGLHITDLPDDMYRESPKTGPHAKYTEEEKLAIIAELDTGISKEELARQHGCCPRSILNWSRKYGVG